jgi:hypothetical protein
MAKKLKTYQTSLGFFDQAIAAPSMKAALEAWGADSNLFHQGAATESDDPDVIAATMAKPGVVLSRPVGTDRPFSEHAELPTDLVGGGPTKAARKSKRPKAKKSSSRPVDKAAERKAALAYEREQRARELERASEEAARQKERERRQRAIDKAQAALDKAEQEHAKRAAAIQAEVEALEKRSQTEEARWDKQKERLEAALRRARLVSVAAPTREGQRPTSTIHFPGSSTRAAWFTAAQSRRFSGASSMTARCNSAGSSANFPVACQPTAGSDRMHPLQVFPQDPEERMPNLSLGRRRAIDVRVKSAMRQQRASTDHPDFMSSRARSPLFEASGHTNLAIALGIVSALQLFFDGSLGIQHGVGPGKRDASPRFGCMEKDDPFPATLICHFDDFKLDAFVFHGRSSKRRHRKTSVEHVQLLRIDVRHDCCRCRCLTTAKVTIGTASPTRLSLQCLSSSSPNTTIQKHIESTLRYLLQSDLPSPITSNQVEHFE